MAGHKKCSRKNAKAQSPQRKRSPRFKDTISKKRGKAKSNETPKILDSTETMPKKRGRAKLNETPTILDSADTISKKRGRTKLSETPKILDSTDTTPKKRGRVKLSEMPTILDSAVNEPKKRGRSKLSETPKVLNSAENIIQEEKRGRKKRSLSKEVCQSQGTNTRKKTKTSNVNLRKDVQYVNCDNIPEAPNQLVSLSPGNDTKTEESTVDPLNNVQIIKPCDPSILEKYEIKEEDDEIEDSVIDLESKTAEVDSSFHWPQVCDQSTNNNSLSGESAENSAVNEEEENYTIDDLNTSESAENVLLSFLNSGRISKTEDHVLEEIIRNVLKCPNSDTDKLNACKRLVIGIRLYMKIQQKDPSIITLGFCVSTEKLYIVLDSIRELFELDKCQESCIMALKWFFSTVGAELMKEVTCKAKSVDEKIQKIRDITIFLEVINNNWKTVSLIKINKQPSRNSQTPHQTIKTDCLDSNPLLSSKNLTSSNHVNDYTYSNLSFSSDPPPEFCVDRVFHLQKIDDNKEDLRSCENPSRNIANLEQQVLPFEDGISMTFEPILEERIEKNEEVPTENSGKDNSPEKGFPPEHILIVIPALATNMISGNEENSTKIVISENTSQNTQEDQLTYEDSTSVTYKPVPEGATGDKEEVFTNDSINNDSNGGNLSEHEFDTTYPVIESPRIPTNLLSANWKNGTEKEVTTSEQNTNNTSFKKSKKKNYCMFCEKFVCNFIRHFKSIHSNTDAVIQMNSLSKNESSRQKIRDIFEELRNKGNSLYNKKVIEDLKLGKNNNKLLQRKKGSSEKEVTLVMCSSCESIYSKKTVWRHKCFKICKKQGVKGDVQYPKIIPIDIEPETVGKSNYIDKMTCMLRKGSVTKIALKDSLLMSLVDSSYKRKKEEKKNQHIYNFISLGCHILQKAKEKDCSIQQLSDCLLPSKIDLISEIIKSLCQFDETTQSIGILSMPYRLSRFWHITSAQALKNLIFSKFSCKERKNELIETTNKLLSILETMNSSAKPKKKMKRNRSLQDTTISNDDVGNITGNVLSLTEDSTDVNISADSPQSSTDTSVDTNITESIISKKCHNEEEMSVPHNDVHSLNVVGNMTDNLLSPTEDSTDKNILEDSPQSSTDKSIDTNITESVISQKCHNEEVKNIPHNDVHSLSESHITLTKGNIEETFIAQNEIITSLVVDTNISSSNETVTACKDVSNFVEGPGSSIMNSLNNNKFGSEGSLLTLNEDIISSNEEITTLVVGPNNMSSDEETVSTNTNVPKSLINVPKDTCSNITKTFQNKRLDDGRSISTLSDPTGLSKQILLNIEGELDTERGMDTPLNNSMGLSKPPLTYLSTEDEEVYSIFLNKEIISMTEEQNILSLKEGGCVTESISAGTKAVPAPSKYLPIEYSSAIDDSSNGNLEKPFTNAILESLPAQKWRRTRNYCMYCGKYVCNFARHLKSIHRNIEEVINLFKLAKTDRPAFLQELRIIRKRGNYVHDEKVISDVAKGSSSVTNLLNYRRGKFKDDLKNLVICSICKGIYKKPGFHKHYAQHLQLKRDVAIKTTASKPESIPANLCHHVSIHQDVMENESVDLNCQKTKIDQPIALSSTASTICSQESELPSEEIMCDFPKVTKISKYSTAKKIKNITLKKSYKKDQLNILNIERAKKFCLYCKTIVPKFVHHLLAVHKDKKPVMQFISLMKRKDEEGKSKRRKIVKQLRQKNQTTYYRTYIQRRLSIKHYGQDLKPSKIPQKPTTEEIVPIIQESIKDQESLTKGTSSSDNTFVNVEEVNITLNRRTRKHKKNVVNKYSYPLINPYPLASQKLKEIVLPKIRFDDYSKIGLSDPLLMAVANKILENNSNIRSCMKVTKIIRDGGKFMKCAQSFDKTVSEFRDFLKPSKIDSVFEVTKELCGIDEKTGSIKYNSVPFQVTHVINTCAQHVCDEALNNNALSESDKKVIIDDMNKFLEAKRVRFRSIIVQWPGSKKPRSCDSLDMVDFGLDSTRTEVIGTNEIRGRPGRGLQVVKRRILSSDESDETSSDEQDTGDNELIPMKETSFFPKKRWTEKQKRIVLTEFKDCILNGKNPGRKRCRELIATCEELKDRTPDQVNLIIDNVNKGKLKLPPEFQHLKKQSTS